MRKPQIILLAGMPAVGKSTYIKQNGWDTNSNIFIHSFDNIVTEMANRRGLSYDEYLKNAQAQNFFAIDQVIPTLIGRFKQAVAEGKDIIVDMVNANVEDRAKSLSMVDLNDYEASIIVLGARPWLRQDKNFLAKVKRAVAKRGQATGKTVPDFILDDMFKKWETPTLDEGFSSITMIGALNPEVL